MSNTKISYPFSTLIPTLPELSKKSAESMCVRLETERKGKTTLTHGYDARGNEIYTAYKKRGLFSRSSGYSYSIKF